MMIWKLAWKHICSRPVSGILTILGSALVLTLLGSFWTLRENLQSLQNNPANTEQRHFNVFVNSQSRNTDVKRILTKVKSLDFVENTELLSSKAALEEFKNEFGETLAQAVDETIIPHVIRAQIKTGSFNKEELQSNLLILKKDESILDIDMGATASIKEASASIEQRLVNWAQVLFLLVFAIVALLISHLIRLAFESAKDDIETMKILGTPGWKIFLPLLFEGLFYGVLSSALSLVMLWGCVKKLLPELATFLLPKNFEVFFLSTSSWLSMVGVSLAASVVAALISLPLVNRPAKRS